MSAPTGDTRTMGGVCAHRAYVRCQHSHFIPFSLVTNCYCPYFSETMKPFFACEPHEVGGVLWVRGWFSEASPVTGDQQQRPRQFRPMNWSHSPTRGCSCYLSFTEEENAPRAGVTLRKTTVGLAGARMSPHGWHPGTTRASCLVPRRSRTLKCPKTIERYSNGS